MTCWASTLGGCSAGSSHEHLVSQGLWLSDNISVVGFPWCKTEPKTVGLASATSKILCAAHNSGLSDVDAAGVDAFRALREATTLANERSAHPHRHWRPKRLEADGPLLERWFLKTTVNLSVARKTPVRWPGTSAASTQPADRIVRMVFGREPVTWPMGLYSAALLGETIKFSEEVAFAPLFDRHDTLVGALFTFRGLRFLLYLGLDPPPHDIQLPGTKMPGWEQSGLLYRTRRLQWKAGGKLSHYLHFMWPPGASPSNKRLRWADARRSDA